MSKDDFDKYLSCAIKNYADEKVKAENYTAKIRPTLRGMSSVTKLVIEIVN